MLLSTSDIGEAMRAFDDDTFSWQLHAQFILLSALETDAPAIDYSTVFSLLENRWASNAAMLREAGVKAVLRAGVDGDVMGLLLLCSDVADHMRHSLENAAKVAGVQWSQVDEAGFASLLALPAP